MRSGRSGLDDDVIGAAVSDVQVSEDVLPLTLGVRRGVAGAERRGAADGELASSAPPPPHCQERLSPGASQRSASSSKCDVSDPATISPSESKWARWCPSSWDGEAPVDPDPQAVVTLVDARTGRDSLVGSSTVVESICSRVPCTHRSACQKGMLASWTGG